jgi:hypothetical protein
MKSNIIIAGTPARVALMALVVLAPAMALFSGAPSAPKPSPRSGNTERHCVPVGGTIMTNFGAIDPLTNTLGPATGDLRGAVSATLLGAPQPGAGGTVVFHVQHHWVTESGDTITFDPAVATAAPLSQTLFAIITYPVHITGGTGKFAGATGDLTNLGEVDLGAKATVFRYSGQVCFAEQD